MEVVKTTYELGLDFYANRIAQAQIKLSVAEDNFDRLQLMEQIEEWQLKCIQNIRRHGVLEDGQSLTIPEHVYKSVDELLTESKKT